jgi:hypothetical protein
MVRLCLPAVLRHEPGNDRIVRRMELLGRHTVGERSHAVATPVDDVAAEGESPFERPASFVAWPNAFSACQLLPECVQTAPRTEGGPMRRLIIRPRGHGLAAVLVGAVAAAWPGAAPAAGQAQPQTTVTVDNTRAVPVVVYLERGEFDDRLGTVAAHTEAILELPPHLAQGETIQIIIHPQGGADLSTPDLQVKKGGTIPIYVPTNDEGFLPPSPPERIPNPGPGTTTLTVENGRNDQVVAFIERGPFDTRIGTVPANEEKTFYLPPSLLRDQRSIQIFVRPEHGRDLASQTFELTPEAHLLVTVPAR